jgi:hypothetical protein
MASHAELDGLRGGFEVDGWNGRLRLGIGIHRSVSINDQLVATSSFVIPHLGRGQGRNQGTFDSGRTMSQTIAPTEVRVNGTEIGPGVDLPIQVNERAIVVQNGPGNLAPTTLGPTAFPTIVQNTLDNQRIAASTVINVSANSLAMMNVLRISDAMRRAMISSGR